LVLSSATSLHGASAAMAVSLSVLQLPYATPSWYSGRLWLLRLGCYKLSRPKEQADDWVWIADHTVQIGQEKCLVIVGVRLRALADRDRLLSHEDVEPLTLSPVKQSNGDIVYQQLKETVAKTGVPRQIVSDHGSDLHAGIKAFCQAHAETCLIYDIKHKTACVLKRELQHDADWQRFTQLAAQSKLKVQQTSLAFLAPPRQCSKARYMNVDTLIRWGGDMLCALDDPGHLSADEADLEVLQEKLGWVDDFRSRLQEWGELMQVIDIAEHVVRTRGLYRGVHREVKDLLAPVAHIPRAKRVSTELVAFIAEESFKARPHERLVGSSEVLESVFGKLKRLEQDQSKGGFTGLILSIAAMVSTTTGEVIAKALQTVPTKQVLAWCKKNLGQSVQSKRRKAFTRPQKTEQKRDQLRAVG
jgi:hypothetical protein